ncbi:hypothetical protein ACWIGW_01220 [Nocardia brasiliensis]
MLCLWLRLIPKLMGFDWPSLPFFTPGWGVVLAGGFTLAGGALGALVGRWNLHSVLFKQMAQQHRIEQREAVAVLADTCVELGDNEQFYFAIQKLAESQTESGQIDDTRLAVFNGEVPHANDRANAVKRAIRRARLVIDVPELLEVVHQIADLSANYHDSLMSISDNRQNPAVFNLHIAEARSVVADMAALALTLEETAIELLKTVQNPRRERENS